MMKKILVICCLLIAASWTSVTPTTAHDHAISVEDVIAKHVEAKGGDAWNDVHNMRITGEFTAFSLITPFTAHRARDRRYHIDHTLNERRVVMGYDGELHWMDNEWSDGGPQPISNPVDLAALERDLDFSTALFDVEARGYEVKLLEDRDEIEGFPAIAIELKRGDGSVETWFLDPDSYLEIARESPGSDFGQPRPSTTFFDDFREVGGVMLPHYVETQWYTRDRVQNIAKIEVNADFDDDVFSLPSATGMDAFQDMVGEWTVKVESKQSPRQPEFTESARDSTITASLNGGLIEERFSTSAGGQAVRMLSYDRFRKHYVMTQMDDARTYLDIQTGVFEDDVLKVSNVETGTSSSTFGANVHERCTISPPSENGFTIERENSMDGGQNWMVMQRLTYTRKTE